MTGLCWFPPDVPWLRALVRILGWKAGILSYKMIHRFSSHRDSFQEVGVLAGHLLWDF